MPNDKIIGMSGSGDIFTISTLVCATLNASKEEKNILSHPEVDLEKEDVSLPFHFIYEKKKIILPFKDGKEVPAVYYHEVFSSCNDFCIVVNSFQDLNREYNLAHLENEDMLDPGFFTEEEKKSDRVTKERLLTYLLWDNYNQGVWDAYGVEPAQKILS